MCFFCQAEDGIRDLTVTGVQTCALPILVVLAQRAGVAPGPAAASAFVIQAVSLGSGVAVVAAVTPHSAPPPRLALAGLAALATILVLVWRPTAVWLGRWVSPMAPLQPLAPSQIGRASCRGRG